MLDGSWNPGSADSMDIAKSANCHPRLCQSACDMTLGPQHVTSQSTKAAKNCDKPSISPLRVQP